MFTPPHANTLPIANYINNTTHQHFALSFNFLAPERTSLTHFHDEYRLPEVLLTRLHACD